MKNYNFLFKNSIKSYSTFTFDIDTASNYNFKGGVNIKFVKCPELNLLCTVNNL